MFDKLKADFRAVFEMDPAATGRLEVFFTYSGFHAILMHRVAHRLYTLGMPFFARVLSQVARFLTGIEIHPAAKIAGSIFIDHGMGVVIGETTEIGEHVVLFQGVTLGGTGKERGKRHPTLGSHVVIGAGAKVLGGITIGDHVKVGANAVVLCSVPPHSTVVGVPGRIVRQHGKRITDETMLDHDRLVDPLAETLNRMQKQIAALEQKLGGGQQAAAPGQPKPREGKRQKLQALPQGGKSPLAEMPVESVQERQARMAKMEKDERMKAIAMRKTMERVVRESAQEGGETPGEGGGETPVTGEAKAPRKRPRRRRRGPKPGAGQPTDVTSSSEPTDEGHEPHEPAMSAPPSVGSEDNEGGF